MKAGEREDELSNERRESAAKSWKERGQKGCYAKSCSVQIHQSDIRREGLETNEMLIDRRVIDGEHSQNWLK